MSNGVADLRDPVLSRLEKINNLLLKSTTGILSITPYGIFPGDEETYI